MQHRAGQSRSKSGERASVAYFLLHVKSCQSAIAALCEKDEAVAFLT
jgi:hypothetical protein